jgi:SAM-dependent methyltransferase
LLEIRHPGVEEPSDSRLAYESIYREEGIVLRDSFYLWLLELLDPEPGRLLMDISCGEGRLAILASRYRINPIGIDFSYEAVKKARLYSPELIWMAGDGESLPVRSKSCDYVTHIGSLEHYEHPGSGALEISRVLKPGGRACILLPNAFGLLGNIRHVMRTGEIFDDGLQPIQRYATRGTWAHLLEQNGLIVMKTIGYGEVEMPRTVSDARWLITHPKKLAKLLITGLIPKNLKNHLVFLCTVK